MNENETGKDDEMADEKMVAVHVTHEATGKIGGIGAVLEGFFTCPSYLQAVPRSILVGPLFTADAPLTDKLGEGGCVLYSSADGFGDDKYKKIFEPIENYYNAPIVYGTREFVDSESGIKSSPEVLLVDVRNMNDGPINDFKRALFEQYEIRSNLYEDSWEFEQYLRLAPPALDSIKALDAASSSTIIISHEFMGMATALGAIMDSQIDFKTAFYAHEVATVRRIIEGHPGHDTMFYNALNNNRRKHFIHDIFGDQFPYFKHALVDAAKNCDSICAVGDSVVDELKFLSPEFKNANIQCVYNGIPAYKITLDEKLESKRKLQVYCRNLLGYKPDYIFTHVTRLVRSKGLWRDLQILRHLEEEFRTEGKTGVMFLLSTEVAQRHPGDIHKMENDYGWPVAHREGHTDLSGGESRFYTLVQRFNARSRNIKIVFINQFGFESKYCGRKMPKAMEFMDIRKGSDIEFGISIYEPFGIAQLEPLTFGGICVVSTVCGCAGFVKDVLGEQTTKNVIFADYTHLDENLSFDLEDDLEIDGPVRKLVEENLSEKVAMQIMARLPKNNADMENLLNKGYDLAKNMSWTVVVENYMLPTLMKSLKKSPSKLIRSME